MDGGAGKTWQKVNTHQKRERQTAGKSINEFEPAFHRVERINKAKKRQKKERGRLLH